MFEPQLILLSIEFPKNSMRWWSGEITNNVDDHWSCEVN